MPVPVFSTGEVLTAANMNAVGLWKVATGTFSNVANFDVTGFTTSYDVHRLVLRVGRHTGSGGTSLTATVRTATTPYATNYFGAGYRAIFNGTSAVTGARNAGVNFEITNIQSSTAVTLATMDIAGMNRTTEEFCVIGQVYDFANSGNTNFGYQNTNLTQSNDRIRVECATNITGSWFLYGYNK